MSMRTGSYAKDLMTTFDLMLFNAQTVPIEPDEFLAPETLTVP